MIKNLAHVCIGCTSLAQVERLYCQTLGFTRKFDFIKDGQVVGFYLQVSSQSYLEFFLAAHVPTTGSPLRHLCLETDDLDALIAHLRAAGYQVGDKQMGADQAWQAWLQNAPDGVAIEFHQYTPDCCQHTGQACVVNW